MAFFQGCPLLESYSFGPCVSRGVLHWHSESYELVFLHKDLPLKNAASDHVCYEGEEATHQTVIQMGMLDHVCFPMWTRSIYLSPDHPSCSTFFTVSLQSYSRAIWQLSLLLSLSSKNACSSFGSSFGCVHQHSPQLQHGTCILT